MKMRSISFGSLCFLLMVGLSGQVGAFDTDDLKQLLETNQCRNCDLTRANLKGGKLFYANLSGANLSGQICMRQIC